MYYNYRYYDPNVGKWINADPIEEKGGDNLYGFLGNNPFAFYDQLGLQATSFEGNFGGEGVSLFFRVGVTEECNLLISKLLMCWSGIEVGRPGPTEKNGVFYAKHTLFLVKSWLFGVLCVEL